MNDDDAASTMGNRPPFRINCSVISGGFAKDQWTLKENREAFSRILRVCYRNSSIGSWHDYGWLYVYKDRHVVAQLVQRAERAGIKAIQTWLERSRHQEQGLDIGKMDELVKLIDHKLEDNHYYAHFCERSPYCRGHETCHSSWYNHGARQLHYVPATISTLEECSKNHFLWEPPVSLSKGLWRFALAADGEAGVREGAADAERRV
ncbi:hypothetical protein OPV22_003505 [Ensete ventricosum]|uniref:RRM domain-containing protein n=1 Tax=Ensete ventricosum TaxID=4639 RepID=A0AAV8S121_ENSVE|nr:hypothetical protein OPV22_003505 [Ensete ventricosum]